MKMPLVTQRGFTLVEILITLVVLVILLGLGVVATDNLQAEARDAERKADIEIIARGLEEYYKTGNPYYIPGGTKGSYPGSNMVLSISGSGWCTGTGIPSPSQAVKYSECRDYWTDALPGVSQSALTPPGKTANGLRNPWLSPEASPMTIMMPKIQEFLDAGYYVYKPMATNDQHCYDDTSCQRFALLYKKETTGEVVIVESKHQ